MKMQVDNFGVWKIGDLGKEKNKNVALLYRR
jgi:hypothetical protein